MTSPIQMKIRAPAPDVDLIVDTDHSNFRGAVITLRVETRIEVPKESVVELESKLDQMLANPGDTTMRDEAFGVVSEIGGTALDPKAGRALAVFQAAFGIIEAKTKSAARPSVGSAL